MLETFSFNIGWRLAVNDDISRNIFFRLIFLMKTFTYIFNILYILVSDVQAEKNLQRAHIPFKIRILSFLFKNSQANNIFIYYTYIVVISIQINAIKIRLRTYILFNRFKS